MMAETTLQGFTLAQRLFAILMAVLIVGGTVELIRRRKLREEYAMLWVCASAAVVVFAIFPGLLFWLLNAAGVYYLTAMVVGGFVFLSLVLMHLAVSASRSADDVRKIAQRLALLEEKLEKLAPPAQQPTADKDDKKE